MRCIVIVSLAIICAFALTCEAGCPASTYPDKGDDDSGDCGDGGCDSGDDDTGDCGDGGCDSGDDGSGPNTQSVQSAGAIAAAGDNATVTTITDTKPNETITYSTGTVQNGSIAAATAGAGQTTN